MKRPIPVTTLLYLVLCLVIWNLIRAIAAINNWTALQEFAPRPGPIYIFISASFWTLSGFALWQALRHRQAQSPRNLALYFGGYATWWWLDRLFLQTPRVNWPFMLSLTLLLSASAVLLIFHPRTKEFFTQRETYDHNTPD